MKRFLSILAICLVISVLFFSYAWAEDINFWQSLLYKKVSVLVPNGQQVIALVNKVTDSADYIWAPAGWIVAPTHIKHCYKNQYDIKRRYRSSH